MVATADLVLAAVVARVANREEDELLVGRARGERRLEHAGRLEVAARVWSRRGVRRGLRGAAPT